jgi:hypothetical protein
LALGLGPEEPRDVGELAEPGHVDQPIGGASGPLDRVGQGAAVLQRLHALDVRADRGRARIRAREPYARPRRAGRAVPDHRRSPGRIRDRGILRLPPEIRPKAQPLGEGGVEDRALVPALRARATCGQESGDGIIQDRPVGPARDLDSFAGSHGRAPRIERSRDLNEFGNDPIHAPLINRPEEPCDIGERGGRLLFSRPPGQESRSPDGFAHRKAVLQGGHPVEMIRQGPVAAGQALRRVVLSLLPAERPSPQSLRELQVEEG